MEECVYMAPTLRRRFHVGLTFEPPSLFPPSGWIYKWVGREREKFDSGCHRSTIASRNFFFLFLPSQHPTNSYLASSSYYFLGTIKLKATHIENGIPQAPKTDDPFFFQVCVCVCLYIFLYGALPGDQHTQCYIVYVCVTHPSVIKLRGGVVGWIEKEGGKREMAATTTTTADQ